MFPTYLAMDYGIDVDELASNVYDPARQEAPAKTRRPDDQGPLSWEPPKPDDRSFQQRCVDEVRVMCGGRR